MNIDQLARVVGLSARLVRYLKSIGLLPKPRRSASGESAYGAEEVRLLRIISHAHGLGFSLRQIQLLTGSRCKAPSAGAGAKQVMDPHTASLTAGMVEMRALRDALEDFAHCKRRSNAEAARIAMQHAAELKAKMGAIDIIRSISSPRDRVRSPIDTARSGSGARFSAMDPLRLGGGFERKADVCVTGSPSQNPELVSMAPQK